jgi:hypothetical protein
MIDLEKLETCVNDTIFFNSFEEFYDALNEMYGKIIGKMIRTETECEIIDAEKQLVKVKYRYWIHNGNENEEPTRIMFLKGLAESDYAVAIKMNNAELNGITYDEATDEEIDEDEEISENLNDLSEPFDLEKELDRIKREIDQEYQEYFIGSNFGIHECPCKNKK